MKFFQTDEDSEDNQCKLRLKINSEVLPAFSDHAKAYFVVKELWDYRNYYTHLIEQLKYRIECTTTENSKHTFNV